MPGSTIGKIFRVTTWGESHGPASGAVIDGCPAGLMLGISDIMPFMERRRPSGNATSTPRKESDQVQILSGVSEGLTTGAPISLLIPNEDCDSKPYKDLNGLFRPGHADMTYQTKYGHRDVSGGGRASGRETAARVAAGAIAAKLLREFGITAETNYTLGNDDPNMISGGLVTCTVSRIPAGLGEPVFSKLDAELAKAVMSIGGVKGVSIGDGFEVIAMQTLPEDGGILGGISTGGELTVKAAVKPCPTALFKESNPETAKGFRCDKNITPRVAPVVEAMVLLTLADALLMNTTSKLENLRRIYLER